jgi:hypothetical protein
MPFKEAEHSPACAHRCSTAEVCGLPRTRHRRSSVNSSPGRQAPCGQASWVGPRSRFTVLTPAGVMLSTSR